jgi:hypothetical protein
MTIGFSLFLIAAGAILRWGVTVVVDGANLDMIGLILMVIGAVGLVIGLFVGPIAGRRTRDERVVDREL